MMNKQLKTLGLILLLAVISASVGYFGMKTFLAGKGTQAAVPNTNQSQNAVNADDKNGESSGQTDTSEVESSENAEKAEAQNQTDGGTELVVVEPVVPDSKPEGEEVGSMVPQEPTDEAENQATESYGFESLDFFSLQVGSYSALSNAKNQLETLTSEGYNAYIFSGSNHKVMAGVSQTREGIDGVKIEMSGSVPDAFVKGMMIRPDAVRYSKADSAALEDFKHVTSSYTQRLKSNLTLLSNVSKLSDEDVRAHIKTDIERINSILSAADGFDHSGAFEGAVSNIRKKAVSMRERLGQIINSTEPGQLVFIAYIQEIMEYNGIN